MSPFRRWAPAAPAASILAGLLLAGCAASREPPPPLPQLKAPEAGLELLWSRRVAGWPAEAYGRQEPALAGGRLWVLDGEGVLWAFDPADGAVRLRRDTGVRPVSGLGAGEGLLAAGGDGPVWAWEAATGERRWEAELEGEVLAPPRIAAGRVLVRTLDGRLAALDAGDGRPLWHLSRPVPPLSLHGTGAPVPAGDLVLAGFADGTLAAVELADGALRWTLRLGVPRGRTELERLVDVDADPVAAGGAVYGSAYQGDLAAAARETGRLLWRRPVPVRAGLAWAEGTLYAVDTGDRVWALAPLTGKALWRQEALAGRRLGPPVALGPYLAVGDGEGWLHLLAREDGHLAGRRRTGLLAGPPLAQGGRLYLLTRSGEVLALGLRRGTAAAPGGR